MVHEEMAIKELTRSNGNSNVESGLQHNTQSDNSNATINGERYVPNTDRVTFQRVLEVPKDRSGVSNYPNGCSFISNPRNICGINTDENNGQIIIRIDKLGLMFNGNTSQISIEEVIRDFRFTISGTAYEWYWI